MTNNQYPITNAVSPFAYWFLVIGYWSFAVIAPASAQDKPPETIDLSPALDKGFIYIATESERLDTSLRFELGQSDGTTKTLTAGATDRNTYTITREALAHEESGLLKKLSVEVTEHKLIQSRLKAGESAEEQTYNGDGPLLGTLWHEEWLADRWVRRQQKSARGPFGARPDELVKLLAVQHTTRGHPLLPLKPVAVGATWTPDTDELKTRLARFAHWPEESKPEIKAECKLKAVTELAGVRTAEIGIEITAKGLVPAKADGAGEWRKGATAELTLKGTLKFNLGEKFVSVSEINIEAKVSGEVQVSGKWAAVTGTVKLAQSATVAREKKAE
jgi:hypothetical protein